MSPNFGHGSTARGQNLSGILRRKAKNEYKEHCFPIIVDARNRARLRGPLPVPVTGLIIFICPDRGRRDYDNFFSRLKPGMDSLVDAHVLVDDCMSMFTPSFDYRVEPHNAHVEIRLWRSGQGQLL